MRLAWCLVAATVAAGQTPGQLTPDVKCAADSSQGYALYVPSNYTPDRTWPVILAFDPGARGRVPVERYQAAAEQYGYIVAGSNTSRNGPWAASEAAIRAMSQDVGQRFSIDERRMYLAGMSGGARFAMGIALGSPAIAGVIASSAGFPDSRARKSVGFVVFGTAGTEDFNYVEMRKVDRELTSPHRLRIFQGSHVWLPPEVATEAVEWLEVQAARSGRAPKDQAKLDRIFAKRTAGAQGSDAASYTALQEIVRDFEGLEDVRPFVARSAELGRDKKIREAIRKEREEEDREERQIQELMAAEARLADPGERMAAMQDLRGRWKRLREVAGGPADTPDRRIARRLSRAMVMSAGERTRDAEYRKLLEEQRSWLGGR